MSDTTAPDPVPDTSYPRGPAIISTLILLIFAARELSLDVVLTHIAGAPLPPANPGSDQLLYAAVTLTLGFWLGSTHSGWAKDQTIKQMGMTLVPPDAGTAPKS